MSLYKCGYKWYITQDITISKEKSMNLSVAPVNFAMVSQPQAPASVETAGSIAFSGAETAGSVASSSCGGGGGFSAVA